MLKEVYNYSDQECAQVCECQEHMEKPTAPQFEIFPKLKRAPVQVIQRKQCPGSNKGVELANTVSDLETSRSIAGRIYPNFETLDAENATSLKKIILDLN